MIRSLRAEPSTLRIAIAAWLALTTATGAVAAAPTTNDTMKATFAAQGGDRAMRRKAYQEALDAYLAAYQIAPVPSAAIGAADALRGLGKKAGALDAYERVLATHGKQLTPPQRSAVDRAIAELTKQTAALDLASAPTDAEIAVDGEKLARREGVPVVRVEPGTRKLSVTKPGFDPFEATLEAKAGETSKVDVVLKPEVKTGHVTITTKDAPEDVRVFVDGADSGPLPWQGDLSPGRHTLELRGARVASEVATLEVAAKTTTELTPALSPRMGHAKILVVPVTAAISVDGKHVGEGSFEGDLAVGEHEVVLAVPGAPPRKETLQIVADAPATLDVTIPLTLDATPATTKTEPERKKADDDRYRGMYFGLDLLAARPTTAPGYACPARDRCGATNTLPPFAGGLLGRAGWAFDPFSLEGTVALLGDAQIDTNQYPGTSVPNLSSGAIDWTYQRDERFLRYGYGGFVGAGGRVTSAGSVARFSAGMSLGGVYRHVTLFRKVTGLVNESISQSESYLSPGLMLDVGIMFGSSPGTKVRIGAIGWVDFPPDGFSTPDKNPYPVYNKVDDKARNLEVPSYKLASSPQFFFGPTVGLQFGH